LTPLVYRKWHKMVYPHKVWKDSVLPKASERSFRDFELNEKKN
jgi:hypothetical protein